MTFVGMDSVARRALRDEYRAIALRDGNRRGRSLKCADGAHTGMAGGCANDGTGCLCGCHDDPESPA
jgi:hypothetical protein